jgi:hypothetical protein
MRGAALTFVLVAASVVGLVACSSEGGGGSDLPPPDPDAGAAVACATGETAEGSSCVPAGLVVCPAGTAGENGACKPTFPATCKAGTARILGQPGCIAIGHTSCSAGTVADASGWGCTATFAPACAGATRAIAGGQCAPIGTCPSQLLAGNVRFVDDDFGAGQLDATHFASIGAALAGAPGGTVVSVAAGTYAETIIAPAGVGIVGTCAGDVVIEPAAGTTAPAVTATSGSVSLRGLTLRGAAVGLLVKGASVTADSLVIDGSRGIGVNVQSGALTLKSSVVRGTLARDAADDGFGIFAVDGKTTLEDVTIDGSIGSGLSVWRTAKVTALRLGVLRTSKSNAGTFGWGIDVESGGNFDGSSVIVSGAAFAGISATDTGTQVRVDGLVVTNIALGTVGPGGPTIGAGLAVTEHAKVGVIGASIGKTAGSSMIVAGGASLVATSVTARDGGDKSDATGGLYASGATATLSSSVIVGATRDGLQSLAGAKVTVDRVLVRDTTSSAASGAGNGIGAFAADKSTLDGKELTLERSGSAQLAATEGASVTLANLAIVDVVGGAGNLAGDTGIGIVADTAAKVKLTNAYVGQSKFLGVSLRRASSFEALGLVIDGVSLVASGDGGFGLLAIEGSTTKLTDFSIHGVHGASLVVGEKGTTASLLRGTLRDVVLDKNPGVARGLSLQKGATATLERVRIEGCTSSAMYVSSSSSASLSACVVDGVVPDPDGKFGNAIEVVDATLRLDRTTVRNAKGAALLFAGSTGAISASLIEDNAVALHAQDGSELVEADEAPAELVEHAVVVTRSTVFKDNETRIGQGVLPLPQPLPLN